MAPESRTTRSRIYDSKRLWSLLVSGRLLQAHKAASEGDEDDSLALGPRHWFEWWSREPSGCGAVAG